MIGLAVGIVAGGIQFWLLAKFTARITSGTGITIQSSLLFIAQFLLPIGVLVAVFFLRPKDLLLTACGIAGSLLIGGFVKFAVNARKTRGRRDNNG